MEIIYTSVNCNELDVNLANIVAMNIYDIYEDDSEDYDLDYDSNDFYNELNSVS